MRRSGAGPSQAATLLRNSGAARSLGALAVLLLVWQFGVPLAGIADYVLPLPSMIGRRFAETFTPSCTT